MLDFDEEIRELERDFIVNLINYLETGVFQNKSNKNFVQAYKKVMDLADQDGVAQKVYDYYKSVITNYCQKVYNQKLRNTTGEELLLRLVKSWENHKLLVYWMRKVFYYLDRFHVKSFYVPKLFNVGLTAFDTEIFQKINQPLNTAIQTQVNKDREGQSVNRQLIKEALICFAQMGLNDPEIFKIKDEHGEKLVWQGNPNLNNYIQQFEVHFLNESKNYFRSQASLWIQTMSCPEFLRTSLRVLEHENDICQKLLDAHTKEPLFQIIINEIITKYAQTLAEMPGTGCQEMFANDKRDQLKVMYQVFQYDQETLDYITAHMGEYIEQRGSFIVEDKKLQEDSIGYTKALLALKEEIDDLVNFSFSDHIKFQRCRDLAFQHFMNKCKLSAPNLASYCDNEMRKELRGVSEQEVEQRFNQLIRLFVCLNDKDVFIKYYTRYLSKRLLDETSVSNEAEQSMISKLKTECGYNIISKISNMYQDIDLSKSINEEFKAFQHGGNPGGIQLKIQVLRQGCWPDLSQEVCQIPGALRVATDTFERFYTNKHQGRSLSWQMGSGTLEINTLYTQRKYTLIVNPYQAAVLLLFNDPSIQSLTLQSVQETTRIPLRLLKTMLLQFFNPRNKILNKKSRGKTIDNNEEISINQQAKSSNVRINLVPKKVKRTVEENKEDQKQIDDERKHILDAVIVRIMKGRRTISHQELLTETMRQVTHFKPQPNMIKTQIESLIQREFIERDKNNRAIYIYIPQLGFILKMRQSLRPIETLAKREREQLYKQADLAVRNYHYVSQTTRLLKKEKKERDVDNLLNDRRSEIQEKLTVIEERKDKFKKRVVENRQKIDGREAYIKGYAKRKEQEDAKLKQEQEMIAQQERKIQRKQTKLKAQEEELQQLEDMIEDHKEYRKYLKKVIRYTDDFNSIGELMQRYGTLKKSIHNLEQSFVVLEEQSQQEIEKFNQQIKEKKDQIAVNNGLMHKMENKIEDLKMTLQTMESKEEEDRQQRLIQQSITGKVMLTIRNLYSKVLQDKGNTKINPYDENGDLSDILDQIKVRIEDLYDILQDDSRKQEVNPERARKKQQAIQNEQRRGAPSISSQSPSVAR